MQRKNGRAFLIPRLPKFSASGKVRATTDYSYRPKSKNIEWEEPPQDGEPFNYNAVPSQFFFELESIGNLEPDAVVQQGIKVMQQKLAAVLQELIGDETRNGDIGANGFGRQSPDRMQTSGEYSADQGYTTPYVNGGTSAWGGAATPYGATPYGQNGWNA